MNIRIWIEQVAKDTDLTAEEKGAAIELLPRITGDGVLPSVPLIDIEPLKCRGYIADGKAVIPE